MRPTNQPAVSDSPSLLAHALQSRLRALAQSDSFLFSNCGENADDRFAKHSQAIRAHRYLPPTCSSTPSPLVMNPDLTSIVAKSDGSHRTFLSASCCHNDVGPARTE